MSTRNALTTDLGHSQQNVVANNDVQQMEGEEVSVVNQTNDSKSNEGQVVHGLG